MLHFLIFASLTDCSRKTFAQQHDAHRTSWSFLRSGGSFIEIINAETFLLFCFLRRRSNVFLILDCLFIFYWFYLNLKSFINLGFILAKWRNNIRFKLILIFSRIITSLQSWLSRTFCSWEKHLVVSRHKIYKIFFFLGCIKWNRVCGLWALLWMKLWYRVRKLCLLHRLKTFPCLHDLLLRTLTFFDNHNSFLTLKFLSDLSKLSRLQILADLSDWFIWIWSRRLVTSYFFGILH